MAEHIASSGLPPRADVDLRSFVSEWTVCCDGVRLYYTELAAGIGDIRVPVSSEW